jgi:hypothetical protein
MSERMIATPFLWEFLFEILVFTSIVSRLSVILIHQ